MNVRIWLARPESTKTLTRVQVAIVLTVALAAAWWGIRFAIFTTSAKLSSAATTSNISALTNARKTVAEAKTVRNLDNASGLQAVVAFQTALDKEATARQVEVGDFQSTSELAPYLSKFSKLTEKSEWLQVAVRISLNGSMQDIFATLAAMGKNDIPFEFDVLDITRGEVTDPGHTVVMAKIELRVLTKEKV